MAKKQHCDKIKATDENHGLRDFCVSMIFYCPYTYFNKAAETSN